MNETLNEIQDPIARAKLEGYQEASYAADQSILQTRRQISEKQGVIAAASTISKRLMAECDVVNNKMDEGEMDHDEAKIRNDQVKHLVEIVDNIEVENRKDLISLNGQIAGIEKANKNIELRFLEEAAKYERWQRVQEEENAEVEALIEPESTEESPEGVESGQETTEDETSVSEGKQKRRKRKNAN